MLCTLLTFVCFYFSLVWLDDKSLKNLLKIAFTLGFGMITKLNCAVMAFPLAAVFLLHFIRECKNGRLWKCIREYTLFLTVTAGIGLSWVIRNLVFYDTNPGVPVLTEESEQYIGRFPYWDVFGIPSSAELEYPFHTINGYSICNVWHILFRTSLFDEIRPDLSDLLMMCCRIALVLATTLGIVLFVITIIMEIREIKKGDKDLGTFLLVGHVIVFLTFIAFILKYMYTCSANYRYVVVGLLFSTIGFLQFSDKSRIKNGTHKALASLVEFLVFAFIFIITLVLLVWNQW